MKKTNAGGWVLAGGLHHHNNDPYFFLGTIDNTSDNNKPTTMVQGKDGVYAAITESPDYAAKAMRILLLELSENLVSKSEIVGIDRIVNKKHNIKIFLEDKLSFDVLEKVTRENNRYYLHKEKAIGLNFYQIRRKGKIWTLGLPTVVLDDLCDRSNTINIRKRHSFFGAQFLAKYLEKLYGALELKYE